MNVIKEIQTETAFYKNQLSSNLIDFLFQRPALLISLFIKHLRFMEFYSKKDVRYYYHYFFYLRLSYKLGFQIPPHTIEYGVRFYHWGTIIITSDAKIGRNCTIYPGVTVGKNYKGALKIGDNCFLGLGSKVLGDVRIGNNVMILANAVVTKDIPDNCIVAGIPAKIIRYITDEK